MQLTISGTSVDRPEKRANNVPESEITSTTSVGSVDRKGRLSETQPVVDRMAQTHLALSWYAFVPVDPSVKVAGAASETSTSAKLSQVSPATGCWTMVKSRGDDGARGPPLPRFLYYCALAILLPSQTQALLILALRDEPSVNVWHP